MRHLPDETLKEIPDWREPARPGCWEVTQTTMNAPKNLPSQSRFIETEAEDHATETARAVRGEISPDEQQHQSESRHRGHEQPNARPHEPWQID